MNIRLLDGLPFVAASVFYNGRELVLEHVLLDTGSAGSIMAADRLSEIGLTYAANDELPQFANEQEEAAFWDMHDSAEFLDETEAIELKFVDARPVKKQISLRLDPAVIEQIKKVAHAKGVGYQTLIRMWVMEQVQKAAVP